MKKLALLFVMIIGILCISANSRDDDRYWKYATVDTDPDASGYWTTDVVPSNTNGKMFFSVTGTGVMTVTLQFILSGQSTWTDYDTYTVAAGWAGSGETSPRVVLDDKGEGVRWRAGVKDDDYTSGSNKFGFDWER